VTVGQQDSTSWLANRPVTQHT